MKARDIISLVDGLAPIITASFDKAAAPLLERIKLLEAHNAELLDATEKMGQHVKALQAIYVPTAEEIAKLVEVKEVDLVATVDLCTKQVLENIPAAPTVEEIAKLVPAGKDADPEIIKTQVKDAMTLWSGEFKLALPELVRGHIAEVVDIEGETVRGYIEATAKAALEALPKPKDGKDVDREELNVIVAEHVEDAMKTLPVPKDGKDASPEEIAAAVEKVLATWPKPKDGESIAPEAVRAMVDEAVAAIPRIVQDGKDASPEQIVEAVEKVLATWPRPKDGESVSPASIKAMVDEAVAAIPRIEGEAGKDATPEEIAAAVEKVLATWPKPKDGESVTVDDLAPVVDEVVARHMAVVRVPQDGKDGVGLAGVLKDHEGCVVFTLTDGTMTKIGRVDGEDGLGFDDLEMVETETEVAFRFVRGDRVKEFSYTKATIADFYKGVWHPGTHKRGALVTWGGSLWMAQRETEVKPETKDNDDWKLIVKRGRDGSDKK